MGKDTKWEKQEGANYWKPEKEGETVEGLVIDAKEGNFGMQYTIRKDDDTEIVTPSHRMLQGMMEKVEKSDVVKIVYLGTKPPTKKGNDPTSIYEVFKQGD